ncbi:MAG: DegT/DnrJ/EryC1/StrS family aminotransferase [Chloroflexi bacterium]|nr:DegT/DnrJ/EryC1/StrS family aminotransferase [Chloroflexota bacterium]
MVIAPATTATIRIPLARPDITEAERARVNRVLESPYLSLGPEVQGFESDLARCAGLAHAIATNSGTSALHLAMLALGIGPGDEVITTPFSFIASSNCILYVGARPVFADIDPHTLTIDPAAIDERITPRTKAVLAVDVFGHPADWDRLQEIAGRRGLALVEDAAEALGASYKGRPAGSFGDLSVFAFYPNKQITTGEGGALLTNNPFIARDARSRRNQGRGADGRWLRHERLGYNYRLSDINCALGRAQLERLPEILAARERVALRYNRLLEEVPEIERPFAAEHVAISWFVYVVRLRPGYTRAQRDRVMGHLRARGIAAGDYFPCIHLEPVYRNDLGYREGQYPVSEDISSRSFALPFFSRLSDEEAREVVDCLKEAVAAV